MSFQDPNLASAAMLATAGGYLGLEEFPGAANNPEVVALGKIGGIDWYKEDSTPWCAVFVNAICALNGLPTTGSAMARSFEKWGREVRNPIPGDIVVFWRGSPSSGSGHVAFFVRWDGPSRIIVRGGNQYTASGGGVTDASHSVDQLVCFRRYDSSADANGVPTLEIGDKGPFVTMLQKLLAKADVFAGKADGHFGPLTEAAVVRYQREMDLDADGVVGPATWSALDEQKKVPQRSVSIKDLRKSGSRTVSTADAASVMSVASVPAIGLTEVSKALSQAKGVVDQADGIASSSVVSPFLAEMQNSLPTLLVVAGIGAIVFLLMRKNRAARLDDAQRGANLGR